MKFKKIIFLGWLLASTAFADPVKELFSAATLGKSERVEALLAKGIDVNAANAGGRTSLMGACFNGNLKTVNTLLAYGADVNKVDHQGNTALMDAVIFGDEAIVKLLITAGANINAVNRQNITVLAKAKSTPYTHIVKRLEKIGAKDSVPVSDDSMTDDSPDESLAPKHEAAFAQKNPDKKP